MRVPGRRGSQVPNISSKEMDSRGHRLRKSMGGMLLLKGGAAACYLIAVPVTLGYLNSFEYGVWLTLSSILSWVNIMDIGVGNGLRNRLAECVAVDDIKGARGYFSTACAFLGILVIAVGLIGMWVVTLLDWPSVLNAAGASRGDLETTAMVCFGLFCFTMFAKIIGTLYLAMQKPVMSNGLVFGGQALALALTYLATVVLPDGGLIAIAVIWSGAPILVYLAAWPVAFLGRYREFRPSVRFIRATYLPSLLGLSVKFFVMQMAGLVLFAATNLVVAHVAGPKEVTTFNVAYRYFSLVPQVVVVILTPVWSAVTDAYQRGENEWIRQQERLLRRGVFVLVGVVACMLAVSPFVYDIWVGDAVSVTFALSAANAIYVTLYSYSFLYSTVLNGMGKLSIQLVNTVLAAIAFVPLALAGYAIAGLAGVVLASVLANSSGAILNRIQVSKLLSGTARGLWAT